mgnify:CR=1 FL=1
MKTVLSTVVNNLEFWIKVDEHFANRLKKIPRKILKIILKFPDSRPYLGISEK